MLNKPAPTLLEQVEAAGCKVDVDTGDPHVAAGLPFKPHDMTSNQILVHEQLVNPENEALVKRTIDELKGQDWLAIHTVLTARFHKRVMPYIVGRVLAQVSPRFGYDKQAILDHARAYAKAYNAEGITNDRFCIKIPTTSCGVQAASELTKEGIATLGTSLFSLPQAIAAQQAGMHAISPYFNEVKAHEFYELWSDVEDPAIGHTMSARMVQIRDVYKKLKDEGKKVPQIKAASCITARECLAMVELGADHNTILIGPLNDLLCTSQLPVYAKKAEWQNRLPPRLEDPNTKWADWQLPDDAASAKRTAELAKTDPLARSGSFDIKLADTSVDYLQGTTLDDANESDPATKQRLKDALDLFIGAEAGSKAEIERLVKAAA